MLVDKPEGVTSHDIVNIIRKVLRLKAVGHTGVLDKPASGLLVLLIGRATKLSQFLSALDKKYQATIVFGARTTTDDGAGEIIEESSCDGLTKESLLNILEDFQGRIQQAVPKYSSVRVSGEKLYKLAIKGVEFSPPIREVEVYENKLLSFKPGKKAVAEVFFHCSKGTYIRSLARDIGENAGCGAFLQKLRRTSVGWMNIDDAITIDELRSLSERKINDRIAAMAEAVSGFPQLVLKQSKEQIVRNGKKLKGELFQNQIKDLQVKIIAILNSSKQLIAMVEWVGDFEWTDGYLPLKYLRVIA